MTTTRNSQTTRPGSTLTKLGLGLAIVGVLLTIAVLSAGGNLVPAWIIVIGLALAGIGFARRVLAALER